jgi:DNA mismatch repair protein MutS
MVEMNETANIVNNATERRLIHSRRNQPRHFHLRRFLHRLECRGISPRQIKARSLFATHYHELTKLAGRAQRRRQLQRRDP